MDELQRKHGKTVKAIDQEKHHRAAHASKCKPCKEAALKATDDSAKEAEQTEASASRE